VRTTMAAARCSRATCAGMRTIAVGGYSVPASHNGRQCFRKGLRGLAADC
jgi:hypothetical protein